MGKAKRKKEQAVKIINGNHGSMIAGMIEDAETQLMLAETQGKIIEKLAYSFAGRSNAMVEGLTYWGMLACAQGAKKTSWTPEWTKPEFQKLEGTPMMLCVVGCRNPRTKLTEWGSCSFNPAIRFDERKALTNAKRYALDKHLAVVQKVAFLQYLKKHSPGNILKLHEGVQTQPAEKFTVSDKGNVRRKSVDEKVEEFENKKGKVTKIL